MGLKKGKDYSIALKRVLGEASQKELAIESNNLSTGKVYTFTNENLPALFKDFDFSQKSVLTVGSSGDQLFESIYRGAEKVTLIDANILAQPFIELKIAAIKNLDYEDACDYFTKENIFNSKYYNRVKHDLSKEVRFFWDKVYSRTSASDYMQFVVMKNFFQTHEFSSRGKSVSFFRDKKIYNNLKEKINYVDIEYIVSEFFVFDDAVNETFDFIFLSNIYDYVNPEKFLRKMDCIARRSLKDNGIMQVYYDFDTLCSDEDVFRAYWQILYGEESDREIIQKRVNGVTIPGTNIKERASAFFVTKAFFSKHSIREYVDKDKWRETASESIYR